MGWCVCSFVHAADIKCPEPGNVPHSMKTMTSLSYGGYIQYICLPGYTLNGTSNMSCLLSGSWSDSVPRCDPIQCGPLTAPAYGSLRVLSPFYEGIAVINCSLGYALTSSGLLTCASNGKWDPGMPRCVAIVCPKPAVPAHAVSLSEQLSYLGVIVYGCQHGYTHHSGNLTRKCDSNRLWTGSSPVCRRK